MLPYTKNKKFTRSLAVPLLLSSSVLFAPQVFAAPTAGPNYYETNKGQSITLLPMRNDGADSGNYIFIEEVDDPLANNSGTTRIIDQTIGSDGKPSGGSKIRYTPPANFTGTTTFFYGIKSVPNNLITSAKITVKVINGGIPTPPPVANDDRATTGKGETIWIGPLWNDTGSKLRITAVDTTTDRSNSAKIVTNSAGVQNIEYKPSSSFTGADKFWYVVTDESGNTDSALVEVAVEGPSSGAYPVANPNWYDVDKNSTDNFFYVMRNDTGDGVSLKSVERWSQKGSTFVAGNRIRYTPVSGRTGKDEFYYVMKDSLGRTNSAKITVNILGATDPVDPVDPVCVSPLNLIPDAVQDTFPSEINLSEFEVNVLGDDIGECLKVVSVTPARSGNSRLTNGQVFYTPPSFTTSDTFRYTIEDSRGRQASAAVTIGVRDPANPTRNPVIADEPNIQVTAGETIIINVLANDSDPDGDTLILDQVDGPSRGFTKKVRDVTDPNPDNLNAVEYTALTNVSSGFVDTFTYGVADGLGGNGSGRVTVTFR